jgi:hypothetical protein
MILCGKMVRLGATTDTLLGIMMPDNNVERFRDLFCGLDRAYGTGKGQWVKQEPTFEVYKEHLEGKGDGLGIAPLRDDGTITFAAIDLDRKDFAKGREFVEYLPNQMAMIDQSRSGNVHIVVFFNKPIDAWVVRGLLEKAVLAAGEDHIEIFPKQDRLHNRAGKPMFGNYLNLPYFGDTRPGLNGGYENKPLSLEAYLDAAEASKHDPLTWINRAAKKGIVHPDKRVGTSEFGTQTYLHRCAEYVIENRDFNPIQVGHRNIVFFTLAKQLANCALFNEEESLEILELINEASDEPVPTWELKRMYDNAVRGEYTSTGCDDPIFSLYADPTCPIAHPKNEGGLSV